MEICAKIMPKIFKIFFNSKGWFYLEFYEFVKIIWKCAKSLVLKKYVNI